MSTFPDRIREKTRPAGNPDSHRTVGPALYGTLEVLLGVFCFAIAMLLRVVVSANGLQGIKPVHFRTAPAFLLYLTGRPGALVPARISLASNGTAYATGLTLSLAFHFI